jgi:hypothetical protein
MSLPTFQRSVLPRRQPSTVRKFSCGALTKHPFSVSRTNRVPSLNTERRSVSQTVFHEQIILEQGMDTFLAKLPPFRNLRVLLSCCLHRVFGRAWRRVCSVTEGQFQRLSSGTAWGWSACSCRVTVSCRNPSGLFLICPILAPQRASISVAMEQQKVLLFAVNAVRGPCCVR